MLNKIEVKRIQKEMGRTIEQLPLFFHALGDPGRFRIFCLFLKYGGLCVTDIAHVLGVSVPAASQQLRIMEMSGLVKKQRTGQMICYDLQRSNVVVKAVARLVSREQLNLN